MHEGLGCLGCGGLVICTAAQKVPPHCSLIQKKKKKNYNSYKTQPTKQYKAEVGVDDFKKEKEVQGRERERERKKKKKFKLELSKNELSEQHTKTRLKALHSK